MGIHIKNSIVNREELNDWCFVCYSAKGYKRNRLDKGNVYWYTLVNIDKQYDEKKASMIMQVNEEILFNLKSGGYSADKKYTKAVVIGESLEKFIFENNGETYISMNDYKFSVHSMRKTIILITHDMNIANQCDRIIRIEDGMIIQ